MELIKKEAPKTSLDTTKMFSFNYYDIKALVKLASCLTSEIWKLEKFKTKKINLNQKYVLE